MPKKTSLVTLSADARVPLEPLRHRGQSAPRQVPRARLLRTAAEGWEDGARAEAREVGRATVARPRQRVGECGRGARDAPPRPGQPPQLEAQAAARVSAAAWRTAPAGRQRWPRPRRADRVVAWPLAASSA
jgi:hypothetical protein